MAAAAAATSMVGVADVLPFRRLWIRSGWRWPAVAAAVERADTALFWSSAVEAGAAASSMEAQGRS